MNITGAPIGRNAMAGSGPSMPDPPEVAAWRAEEQARQARMGALKGTPAGFTAGVMGGGVPARLPAGLQTGFRKLDNSTAGMLGQGTPYEQATSLLPYQVWFESTPMSEGGGAEPKPGFLDMVLPSVMGLAAGGVGALNGLSTLGSSVLGATTSGLFSGNPINVGLGVVGAGAANALSHLRAVNQPKGFTNTNLGLTGDNLALPGLQNAPGYVPPTPGVGAGALGYVDALGRATTNIPGLNLANAPKVTGTNPYPLGGLRPEQLYNPQALGGPGASRDIPLPDLPSMGGADVPGAGGALNEGATAGGAAQGGPGLVGNTDAGSAGGPSFDATLTGGMGGGKGPGNALAGSGMGAGLIPLSERDMIRNPGYQPRPFGNYVLR